MKKIKDVAGKIECPALEIYPPKAVKIIASKEGSYVGCYLDDCLFGCDREPITDKKGIVGMGYKCPIKGDLSEIGLTRCSGVENGYAKIDFVNGEIKVICDLETCLDGDKRKIIKGLFGRPKAYICNKKGFVRFED